MKTIKTVLTVLMVFTMTLSLAAFGSTDSKENTSAEETSAEETSAEATSAEETSAHSDVLVAYFSATGTTKGVAEKIAAITGGDLYEILAADPYTEDDLNYNDSSSRSTSGQNDKNVRPEIGSEDITLEGYTTIYLGFPIWWGEEPRILDTFVEKYSFEGITVIPFCTSGGSGIGRSGSNMETLAESGTWLDGERFSGSVSEEELQSWIEGLNSRLACESCAPCAGCRMAPSAPHTCASSRSVYLGRRLDSHRDEFVLLLPPKEVGVLSASEIKRVKEGRHHVQGKNEYDNQEDRGRGHDRPSAPPYGLSGHRGDGA